MALPDKLSEYRNLEWFHGEDDYNARKDDKFFSASEDIADNFGKTRKMSSEEFPTNPLITQDKEDFAEIIGYKGDPMAEPKMPEGQSFDELAQAYAMGKGYDGIIYEEGMFGKAELHSFR